MGVCGNEPRTLRRNSSNFSSILPRNDDYKNCPNDQYLCPFCENVPELVNIFTDNGYVEFKCKEHGNILLTVKQYFEKMNNSEFNYLNFKCSNCPKIQKDCLREGIFQFCYECRKVYCLTCSNKTTSHIDKCINVNEMNINCPDHAKEFYRRFCLDDHENVCEKYASKKHRGHKMIKIDYIENIETKIQVIKEKNKILKDLIRFNELILNTYEKFPENYFHKMNVKILADSYEAENNRKPKELESIFKELEMNLKIKENAIKEFKEKHNLEIKGNEEKLIIRNKGLNDYDLKLLSKMKLTNLKEIDLPFNNIKNIEYFGNFFLGCLEYLGLNNNKIEDISVFENMVLNKLKELNLQNNNIKKIKPLIDAKMPVLELLRIEGNNDLNPSMKEMKQVIEKYTKQIVYVVQTLEDFSKKYEVKIQRNSIRLDLNGNSNGNEILKDLYLILPENNELTELRLADCGIDNISILSRLSLPKVEKIDLSFNNIIHIEALCNLKENKLKYLYLNDNNISDIFPLKKIKFYGKYAKITIENNNIIKTIKVEKILKELEAKNIQVKIDEKK